MDSDHLGFILWVPRADEPRWRQDGWKTTAAWCVALCSGGSHKPQASGWANGDVLIKRKEIGVLFPAAF